MSAHDTTFYDYSLLSTLFYFHHKKYTIWLMINMNQYDMNYGIPNARRSLIHKQYWCTHSRCEAQAFDWLSPMNRWHMFCSLPTFWFLFLAFVVVVANMGIWHGTVADTTFICFNEWKIADVVCELRNILANFFFFILFSFVSHWHPIGNYNIVSSSQTATGHITAQSEYTVCQTGIHLFSYEKVNTTSWDWVFR